jgi:transposase
MKTKSKHTAVGLAIGSAVPVPAGPLTVGMDPGDKKHSICVLDATGKVLCRERIPNDRPSLAAPCRVWMGATFVMEVGLHSPWISRCMQGLRCRVIVANARKVRAIYKDERKNDDKDAELLARIAWGWMRSCPTLCSTARSRRSAICFPSNCRSE